MIKAQVPYGSKSFSLEVKPTTDVFDDFCLWIESAHKADLSLKVISLLD
jgi:hypothetical protein